MPATIRLQPLPTKTLVYELNGVTALTRIWNDDAHRQCRLCRDCEARGVGGGVAVCTVLTEEAVTDGGAPLYSSRGLDLGASTSRGFTAPLGVAR